jgi:replicative DNA helicase
VGGDLWVYNDIYLINHWINSGDIYFLFKNKISAEYFDPKVLPIVSFIEKFSRSYNKLPSHQTLVNEFEEYKIFDPLDLDPIEKIVNSMRGRYLSDKVFVLVQDLIKRADADNFVDVVKGFQTDLDKVVKQVTTDIKYYSWVKNALDRFNEYMKRHGKTGLLGLPTGLSRLDELIGGIMEDDFILISARTGQGKSLLGDYIGYSVWKHCLKANIKNPVVCINTEMTATQVSYRLDTLKAHFSNSALRFGNLENVDDYAEYIKRLQSIENDYCIITQDDFGRNFTPLDIRRVIEDKRPVLVIVDQLYDISDGTGEKDIRKRIVNVSNALRTINLETRVPMVVMAQTGREFAKEAKKDANATPELYQIQESDNPAQKATKVLTLRLSNNIMTISLKKNRDGKKDETMFLNVDIDKGIWSELDESEANF